jgi:hypothetical protein
VESQGSAIEFHYNIKNLTKYKNRLNAEPNLRIQLSNIRPNRKIISE